MVGLKCLLYLFSTWWLDEDSFRPHSTHDGCLATYTWIFHIQPIHPWWTHSRSKYTGWRTKCHTIDCAHNTFLLLQKHLTPGTELILIGWKIVPNEEHVQCDHRFASQPLANEPLYSSQLFDTSLLKACRTTSLCGSWAALHFLASKGGQKMYELGL